MIIVIVIVVVLVLAIFVCSCSCHSTCKSCWCCYHCKKYVVTIAVICIVDSIGVYQICGTSPGGGKKKGGVPKRPGFLLGSTHLRAGS